MSHEKEQNLPESDLYKKTALLVIKLALVLSLPSLACSGLNSLDLPVNAPVNITGGTGVQDPDCFNADVLSGNACALVGLSEGQKGFIKRIEGEMARVCNEDGTNCGWYRADQIQTIEPSK